MAPFFKKGIAEGKRYEAKEEASKTVGTGHTGIPVDFYVSDCASWKCASCFTV